MYKEESVLITCVGREGSPVVAGSCSGWKENISSESLCSWALGLSLSSFPTKPSPGEQCQTSTLTFPKLPQQSLIYFFFIIIFGQNLPKMALKLLPPPRAQTFVWAGKSGATAELEGCLCFRASNPTNLLMHRQSKCQTNEIPAYAFKGENFRPSIAKGTKLREANKSQIEDIFPKKYKKVPDNHKYHDSRKALLKGLGMKAQSEWCKTHNLPEGKVRRGLMQISSIVPSLYSWGREGGELQ